MSGAERPRGGGGRRGRPSGTSAADRVRAAFIAALVGPEAEGGGALTDGRRVVAAVSGGLDSCVLLHLLRFARPAPALDVVVAHFDHRMRPSSGGDARWLAGLCRAWALPLEVGRADPAPRSEEAARRARYAFLERVRRSAGAELVLTAHHADDQAETVLFRVLRGTGIAGLSGLPPRREPGLLRPLLGLWRDELEAYARAARLSWREDPSNENLGLARNALRRVLIPEAERRVAPGARRALVRLARTAAENEAAWESLLPELLADVVVEGEEAREAGEGEARAVVIDRAALLARHPALRTRLLRALARRLGVVLDAAPTGVAARFAATGASGHQVDLGRGLTLRRTLDRLVLRAGPATVPDGGATLADRAFPIPDAGPGRGVAVVGGRELAVAWGCALPEGLEWAESFRERDVRFPLVVRGRAPGDRIRLPAGSRKLKKLLLERRVPVEERRRVPVLVDAEGEVLWVPGLARAAHVAPPPQDPDASVLRVGIG